MKTERLFLASTYYPPYGDDLRKVTFNVPWRTWGCLYRWRENQPKYGFRIEEAWYPSQKDISFLKDIRHGQMSHDAPSGYERLWLGVPDTPPEWDQLTFAIDEGTLDFLIWFTEQQGLVRLRIKIWRVEKWWEYIRFLKPLYEGHFFMTDIQDESG